MPIKAMEEYTEATREAGMKKHTTRSTVRIRNATSAGKKDIHRPIAQIEKGINTIMTRLRRPPVVERARRI